MATESFDVQKRLDDWLAANPDAQQYVSKLWYMPESQPAPDGVTHKVRLSSVVGGPERALSIGAVVKPEFALFLDALLAMIATQPPI